MWLLRRFFLLFRQLYFKVKPRKRCSAYQARPHPGWVSMVNLPWFGAYGHGEGRHLLGYPSEIDWLDLEADLQQCDACGVEVIRAFIFENLDGLTKNEGYWHLSLIARERLAKIRHLLLKYRLRLEACLFEFKNEEAQPFLRDFLAATPFRPVIAEFIREMREVLWSVDLHNEIDYLHLKRGVSREILARTIAAFREQIKSADGNLAFTCSTGWRGGSWARRGEIGVASLDFVEVHHYRQYHGDPWDQWNARSLCGLDKLSKPVLLGEFRSDEFEAYAPGCYRRGFLAAAPWSIRKDYPISREIWSAIRTFNQDTAVLQT